MEHTSKNDSLSIEDGKNDDDDFKDCEDGAMAQDSG